MSLTSLLLAFLAPVAARLKPVDKTAEQRLADALARIDELEAELEQERRISADWREECERANRQYDYWRNRALYNQPQQYQANLAMQQENMQAYAYNQLLNQQTARNEYLQGLGYPEMWASCTPSRGRTLTGLGSTLSGPNGPK